ncbi:MAG: 50S ribosomal protein L11 methyltransferase, partial [Bacteriovorax sp.]|nr:50S ribosomal protein L11 methyltransferase [Bacteriovorax sp.]
MNPIVIYIIILIAVLIVLSYTFYILYLQFMPGAFYYPSTDKEVVEIIKLAKPKKTDLLIDLGSGDGRIVIAAAQMGIKSIGYELDPILVKKSRQKIKKLNLSSLAKIEFKNFWKADFEKANIVCIYQFPK